MRMDHTIRKALRKYLEVARLPALLAAAPADRPGPRGAA
jgi:hypothetical protein